MNTAEPKFTPGPWRVGPYYRHEVVSDSGVICCAPIETEQTRTNARLIASAPELLQVARDFVQWVDDVWGSAALGERALKGYEEAKAAIRKATEGA